MINEKEKKIIRNVYVFVINMSKIMYMCVSK